MATIDNLSEITNSGFKAASFVEIKDALANKMREIYGQDIDISAASADGQFVMAEALVINNIYRTLESINANIQPATASGKYLDILASFTNTRRNAATYSTAVVYVKNTGDTDISLGKITCIDKSGNTWVWLNPVNVNGNPQVTIAAGDVVSLTFTCTIAGPVFAGGGGTSVENIWAVPATGRNCDIYEAVESSNLDVYQKDDSALGSYAESDASLRSRRLHKQGVRSQTVIDALEAKLYDIGGIKDVYVLNNATSNAKTAPDSVSVPSHDVYVAVRPEQSVILPTVLVANAIYSTLTPGVLTTAATSGGESFEIEIVPGVKSTICWKQCGVQNATITITFAATPSIGTLTDDQKTAIVKAAKNYLDNISISGQLAESELIQAVNNVDFKSTITGQSTYFATAAALSISGTTKSLPYQMPLAYFNIINDPAAISGAPAWTATTLTLTSA